MQLLGLLLMEMFQIDEVRVLQDMLVAELGADMVVRTHLILLVVGLVAVAVLVPMCILVVQL